MVAVAGFLGTLIWIKGAGDGGGTTFRSEMVWGVRKKM
jgi:hypothetical protein